MNGFLERLAGTWRATETLHPSPWDPKGGPRVPKTDFLDQHPDLREVVARWPRLPAEVRRSILAIVGTFKERA